MSRLLGGASSASSSGTNLPLETTPGLYAGLVVVAGGSCLLGGLLSVRTILRVDPASVFRG